MPREYSLLKLTPFAAGVDEAGRGCLAGPVFAAAVILRESFKLPGLTDSKLLTTQQREELEVLIKDQGIWAIASISEKQIDKHNILQATLMAMEKAVLNLNQKPEKLYIDGLHFPKSLTAYYKIYAKPKADQIYASVAAASVLAKTARDRYMKEESKKYPIYGFEQHFGYGTKKHLEALSTHGPCVLHRMTFSPIAKKDQTCLPYDD